VKISIYTRFHRRRRWVRKPGRLLQDLAWRFMTSGNKSSTRCTAPVRSQRSQNNQLSRLV